MSGIYPLYLLWIAGLIAEVTGQHDTAIKLAGVTVAGLFFFFFSRSRRRVELQKEPPRLLIRSNMFSKKSRPEQEEHTPVPADNGSQSGERDSTTTVIGEGTVVEGNILQGKNADVYGELTGDITLPAGTVRVMQGGKVNGTVRAAGIVVGGEVEGGCEGQSVTVLAQGVLRGTCRSGEFSIKPGGVFTGTSETLPESGVKAKTVTERPVARRKDTGVPPAMSDGPVSDSTP